MIETLAGGDVWQTTQGHGGIMKRSRTLGVAILAAAALLAPAPLTHADSVTVTAHDLLNGRLVESWGACDMPGGWLTVHHDGWTSAGAGVG